MTNDNNDVLTVDLHNVEFTCAMHNRNWNRFYFPFLGCYCHWGNKFKEVHTCMCMIDEEHVAFYENSAQAWEEMKSIEEEASIADHVDCWSDQKFGVNNFGLYPKYFHYRK